ncbi:hypothetical protein TNCT_241831 [Trichonephila clavata]|uniref:Uncharacterized protein n=1 Tax=Trichonephila clavata TaxID=2740835 RepID=A0A8X6HMJ5_TRICU|nr:hypothetical protein TNCT_241831 [Trichonephila clavata]
MLRPVPELADQIAHWLGPMSDVLEMNSDMRLWPVTSRSSRNSLANVRCAEARLFGRGAFYKLGTEQGVLKQLFSRRRGNFHKKPGGFMVL